MIVLVCGDREWLDEETVALRLSRLPAGTKIIHGACRGADTCGGVVARRLGFTIQAFPAQWDLYGPSAGPKRNILMLEQKPDLVIAFHSDISKSRGTAHTVREAKKRKITVEVISCRDEAEDIDQCE